VGHNVVIGEDSVIVAQVAIGGSTRIGSNVTLAGQVGVADHAEIGDNVMVGGQSGVANKLAPNAAYSGTPAIPHREYLRVANVWQKLPEMKKTLLELENRLARIEAAISSGKEK
jgi:UDP-3-O-[3-hydroxymyristoyl] glucosamine N-acyltransferase